MHARAYPRVPLLAARAPPISRANCPLRSTAEYTQSMQPLRARHACTASPPWCAAAFQSVPSARRRVGKRLLYPGLCFGCLPRNCHQPWPLRRRSICRARRDAYNATRGVACSIQHGTWLRPGHTRQRRGQPHVARAPRCGGGLRTAAVLRGAFARETRCVSRAGASDEKTNECMLRRAACCALSRALARL